MENNLKDQHYKNMGIKPLLLPCDGLSSVPANILIGPDKRVITQDIRGKELIDKVRQLTEQDKEKEKAASHRIYFPQQRRT